ncbi:MAG: CpsD/CapB family tyrosine-protein kinase [Chloroflexota bacterium]
MTTIAHSDNSEAATGLLEAPMDDESRPDTWLRSRRSSALANGSDGSREWVFPDADELFRSIYTRAGAGFSSEVLAVCSALAGEGKTTVSVGLAVTIAQDFPERRVLLVETDLQHPVLAEDFGTHPSPGLIDCLVHEEPLLSACRPTFLENFHVVPAGVAADEPGRPLRSSRMAAVVDAMRQSYDIIILDLPAILVNSDSILLTDLADGVICVVRAGITPIALHQRAVEQIEPGKLRGVVMNGSASSVPGWVSRLAGL